MLKESFVGNKMRNSILAKREETAGDGITMKMCQKWNIQESGKEVVS